MSLKTRLQELKFKTASGRLVDGRMLFASEAVFNNLRADLHTGFVNRLKTRLKGFPWLYSFIFYFVAPALFLGKGPKFIYQLVPAGGLVADIGSGNRRLHPDIINVDIHPWPEVDILADAHDLPFVDASLDGVVLSWVIEHMHSPLRIIEEIFRVLKPGGCLYLSTNFITPYHSSPKDYYRWTADGLGALLKDFEIIELKPYVGPTCAFLSVLQEWLALVLSFNVRILKDLWWIFFVVVTSPAKLLDLILIRYSSAENIAAGFYVIAKKE